MARQLTGRGVFLSGVPSAEIRAEPESLRQMKANELGRRARGLGLVRRAIPRRKAIPWVRPTEEVCHER